MQILWLIIGFASLGLGILGIALPLLPTVPFILLAAFCFARSSERLHAWLLSHPMFGPMIEDWHERGAISRKVKRLATFSILAVFGISVGLGAPSLVLTIQAVVLGCVMVFIWTRPNG
ncbi:MAG: YbaN family protein [Roseovarius sp.]|nr:YbaN family protein [Roseovarius sp.]